MFDLLPEKPFPTKEETAASLHYLDKYRGALPYAAQTLGGDVCQDEVTVMLGDGYTAEEIIDRLLDQYPNTMEALETQHARMNPVTVEPQQQSLVRRTGGTMLAGVVKYTKTLARRKP